MGKGCCCYMRHGKIISKYFFKQPTVAIGGEFPTVETFRCCSLFSRISRMKLVNLRFGPNKPMPISSKSFSVSWIRESRVLENVKGLCAMCI
jgi:hypothetical protein